MDVVTFVLLNAHLKHFDMVKKVLFLSLLLLAGIISLQLIPNANSNTSGAPAARSGAPNDNNGATCTTCHAGTATTQAGILTSNVPASGYAPGFTYQITATFTSAGSTKMGFQVSPQDGLGNQMGAMVVTNSTETKILNAGKYITHKTAGTSAPTSTKTWTFDWTAPATGSGAVTLYGAFNATNSNQLSSGDLIVLSTLQIQPDLSAISESPDFAALNVFPVPAQNELTVNPGRNFGATRLSVVSMDGRLVKEVNLDSFGAAGTTIDISTLPQGIYFLSVEADGKTAVRRFMKLD